MNRIEKMKLIKKMQGFTLIELMIVVAILSIIVTIGYPMYVEQGVKSRRADAKVALTDAAQVTERCRTNTNTYTNCFTTTNSSEGFYQISTSATANTYTLTAAIISGKSQANDTKCASFTLAHTGARGATSSDCW